MAESVSPTGDVVPLDTPSNFLVGEMHVVTSSTRHGYIHATPNVGMLGIPFFWRIKYNYIEQGIAGTTEATAYSD